MSENWTYLGTILTTNRTPSQQKPSTCNNVSGWAARAPLDTVSPSTFVVVWSDLTEDKTLLLWCTREERDYIGQLISDGYRVWITGMLLMSGRTGIVTFERASVWYTEELEHAPSVGLAKILWNSNRRRVLFEWGETIANRKQTACTETCCRSKWNKPTHPHAYESVQTYAQIILKGSQETSLLTDLINASDREANIRTGLSTFNGENLERLGNSSYAYNPEGETVQHLYSGRGSTKDEGEVAPSGYLMCGDDSIALLHVTAIILSADRELKWQYGASGTASSLVVVPRHALHLTVKIIREKCPWMQISHTPTQIALAGGETDPDAKSAVVLVTSEGLKRFSALFEEKTFHRCIYVDWPFTARTSSSHAAVSSRRGIKCTVAVGLALADNIPPLLEGNKLEGDLGALFGINRIEHVKADNLQELLDNQVMHLYGEPRHKELMRYTMLEGPELSEREQSLLRVAAKARSRSMRSLYGELMPMASKTASIKDTKEIEEFFAKRMCDYETSIYKREAFEKPTADCPICFDVDPDCVTSCGHYLCHDCYQQCRLNSSACPLCKTTISSSGVVRIASLTSKTEMGTGFVEFLSGVLNDGKKKVLLGSYGEVHEALAASLRERGTSALAWAGNSKQALLTVDAFEAGDTDTLIVDPLRMDLRWIKLSKIERAIIILPLENGKLEACCAVRLLLEAIEKSPQFDMVFIRRKGDKSTICQEPSCMDRTWKNKACPFLVSEGGKMY